MKKGTDLSSVNILTKAKDKKGVTWYIKCEISSSEQNKNYLKLHVLASKNQNLVIEQICKALTPTGGGDPEISTIFEWLETQVTSTIDGLFEKQVSITHGLIKPKVFFEGWSIESGAPNRHSDSILNKTLYLSAIIDAVPTETALDKLLQTFQKAAEML